MEKVNLEAAIACIEASNRLINAKKNEQVIRDSFTSFLRSMFPDAPAWVDRHVKGGEAAMKISKGEKTSTGFVDNLLGLTAIEYESNLTIAAKYSTGYLQVKDYCAGLLNAGNDPDLVLGVLSDTVRWHAYRVNIPKSCQLPYTRDKIELEEIEAVDASAADDRSAQLLIRFLIRHLARLGARPITAQSIAEDLGFSSKFCFRFIHALGDLVKKGFEENPKYADLIQGLWCNFVSYLREGGQAAGFNHATYVDEFYILTLGKLICANFIKKEALLSDEQELKSILKGRFFENRGILNLVEYDYFGWLNADHLLDEMLPVARGIQEDLRVYNFGEEPREDLFGTMMAQLANRSQRLLLGQEWTPGWLSNALVQNVVGHLPEDLPLRLLDMCCGSGSMIVETLKIARERLSDRVDLSPEEKIKWLTQAITGFDIDPLAVMLSKINWVLTSLDLISELDGQSVSIPVYHADSLFAITPLSDTVDEEIEARRESFQLRVADVEIELPAVLITPEFQQCFDVLIDRAYRIVNASILEPSLELTEADAADIIEDVLYLSKAEADDKNRASIENFFRDFVTKVDLLNRDGRNGIWASILKNSYRPGLVTGQFNGLVSNPPWLALSKIANNPYQVVLHKKAEAFGIKPQGSSHLHIELATIFLLHSIEKYLSQDAFFGCIVPETLLNGHHQNPFRRADYLRASQPVSFGVEEVWRIANGVFKNEAIVLYGRKTDQPEDLNPIPCVHIDAEGREKEQLYKHQQGNRTAWSVKEPRGGLDDLAVHDPAPFRQGADLMPRTVLFCERSKAGDRYSEVQSVNPQTSKLAFTVTGAKKHQDFYLSPRRIPNDLIFNAVTSNLLTPFHVADFQSVLLPLRRGAAGSWELIPETRLAAKGAVVQNTFVQMAQIAEYGGKGQPAGIFDYVNTRRGKLVEQLFPSDGYIVFTGAGGGKVCCAYVALEGLEADKLIFDQTVYWAHVKTEEEAMYLSGVLNSAAVSELIADFQPKGAFGKRHVHKLPFGVTPPFDPVQAAQQEVVEKTRELLQEFDAAIQRSETLRSLLDPNNGSLARRRSKIWKMMEAFQSYEAYAAACRAVYGVEGG